MTQKKKFMLKLETKEGEGFYFFGIIHKSENRKDLLLDPENFYEKFSEIPKGLHYEVQWVALPLIFKNIKKDLIHIHEEREKNFICWTRHVSTEEEAVKIIKLAGSGMLYGAKEQEDFAGVFIKCNQSINETIETLSSLCNLSCEPLLFFDMATIEVEVKSKTNANQIFFL